MPIKAKDYIIQLPYFYKNVLSLDFYSKFKSQTTSKSPSLSKISIFKTMSCWVQGIKFSYPSKKDKIYFSLYNKIY